MLVVVPIEPSESIPGTGASCGAGNGHVRSRGDDRGTRPARDVMPVTAEADPAVRARTAGE